MKLLDLTIRHLRGIRDLSISTNGRSHLIVGDNGTGKSAILDALDFLLTGDIYRLTGRRGASMREHGAHVAADRKACVVVGSFDIPGIRGGPVTLRRSMASPSSLSITNATQEAIEPFLQAANRRQHILTRDELLAFIKSAPNDRASAVQSLLKLERLEVLRKSLTSATNTAEKLFKQRQQDRKGAEGALCSLLDLKQWDEASAIRAVNSHRATLSATAISELGLATDDVPEIGEEPIAETDAERPTDIKAAVQEVGTLLSDDKIDRLDALDKVTLTSLNALQTLPGGIRDAKLLDLVTLGLDVLDGAAQCPLCDKAWDPKELSEHLASKKQSGHTAAPLWQKLSQSTQELTRWLGRQIDIVQSIVDAGAVTEDGTDPAVLLPYQAQLEVLSRALLEPLSDYRDMREAEKPLSSQLHALDARANLRILYKEHQAAAKPDPKRVARDLLARTEERFKVLCEARSAEAVALTTASRLRSARDAFIEGRDKVLASKYDEVKDRFVELYKRLHSEDEHAFDAELNPTETGLDILVDFYGKRRAAPFALHSEGHQDCMGLCLFLALSEHTEGITLGFCMLDDVVMSVDANHRQHVAELLSDLKRKRQFIITTHDQVWARRLLYSGCVESKNVTRFASWSLQGNILRSGATDFPSRASEQLDNGDVPGAAHTLRVGLEEFFQVAADALGACVPFSISGQYDYGSLSSACSSRLRELIEKARKAASSWSQDTNQIDEWEQRRKEALTAVNVEAWAVNPNVHYNPWMNMTASEFRDVLEAHESVVKLYMCQTCNQMLKVQREGATPKAIACGCPKVHWTLQKKPGAG